MGMKMRVILYTGKGGVGKTSVAAASACTMAQQGVNVLIMSTDQAHSLGDSLDVKLGDEPVRVMEHLEALEVNAVKESEKNWSHFKDYMKEFLSVQQSGGIEVEELLVFPGMEELFSMFRILDTCESGKYDVVIVDCAPTGETLSLLKYPERLSDFMEKVLPIKRKGVKYAGPAVEKMLKIPMPEDNVFDDIEVVMERMRRLQELLLNKKVVSLRIVTTPEHIVIQEAKRNFTCLNLFNYNVDAIVVNRIYPQSAMEGYFSKWIEMQKEGLEDIERSFSEVPKFYLELQKSELCTIPVLVEVGRKLFQNTEIEKVLYKHESYTIIAEKGKNVLRIYLPFAVKEELELSQTEQELMISVKNEVRNVPLPLAFQNMSVTGAKLEDGYLSISF